MAGEEIADAGVVLRMLRGSESQCGCGRPLVPKFDEDGKRIGVCHESYEDDEWHCRFFSGLFVEVSDDD